MPLPSVLDEINRLFDELVRRPWGAASRQLVPVQLREVKDGWIVDLPVEGVRATDLKVEVHDRQLTVSGQRRSGQQKRAGQGWTHTREEVSWYRTVPLPMDANPDDVEASMEGSTLTIHIGRRKR
ncbi:MAG TPA: Hsp20/alpha crystallin family protein [Candidatus Margulisiibacteriota bacterium]|nr:Hsp20/alpha crystallin family protein [Candidatus Margulisiibacteriota bacterium]